MPSRPLTPPGYLQARVADIKETHLGKFDAESTTLRRLGSSLATPAPSTATSTSSPCSPIASTPPRSSSSLMRSPPVSNAGQETRARCARSPAHASAGSDRALVGRGPAHNVHTTRVAKCDYLTRRAARLSIRRRCAENGAKCNRSTWRALVVVRGRTQLPGRSTVEVHRRVARGDRQAPCLSWDGQ